ncbi:hypothetical protein GCM10027060_26550 [Nesterenkonia halophila]
MADDCSWWQLGCQAEEKAGEILGGAIQDFARSVWAGLEEVMVGMGTMWLNVKTLDPTEGEEHSPYESTITSENVVTALDYMIWLGGGIAVLALILLGGLIALKMRAGEGIQAAGKIGIVLGAVVLMGAAGSLVGALGMDGGASFMENTRGTAGFIQQQLYWMVLAAAIAGVIFGSIKMIWEQRADPGKDVLKQLLTLVVVGALGTTLMSLLTSAADHFADVMIDNATGDGDFANSVMDMLFLIAIGTTPNFAAILVIVLGLIAIGMSLLQMILMVARSGMLVLLAGVLPLTASFTNTEMGKNWFKKSVGWTIAFILYKPVAAIIYAAAFDLVGSGGAVFSASEDGTDFLGMMAGFMMMLLALFALPALLRFVSPAMAAMGGGALGGAAAGAAMTALPTGAQAMGRLGGGSSDSSSSSGSSGPSGSDGQSGSSGPSGPSGSDGQAGATGSQTSGGAASAGVSGGSTGGGAAASGGAAGGAAASGAGGGAAAGGAAGGGAAAGGAAAGAGAAAGPVGAGVAAGAQAVNKGKEAAQAVSNEAADSGDGGEQPSGSK